MILNLRNRFLIFVILKTDYTCYALPILSLKLMKQSRAHFQIIEFRVFSTEDLENYTNPEFYKGGVDSLYTSVQKKMTPCAKKK